MSACPLCGQSNQCGVEAGASTCWCMSTRVSPEARARVPPGSEGVCLCPACAQAPVSPSKAAISSGVSERISPTSSVSPESNSAA
ncbi:cysteine-rich CWC family protein [Chitinibacteraceae bacterium HSL-7]